MQKNPKINFIVDPEYDIEWVKEIAKRHKYYDERSGNQNIFQMVIKKFPNLTNIESLPESEWDSLIRKEILSEYKKFSKEINKEKLDIQKKWRKIEKKYFTAAKKLFDNTTWPTDNLKCVLSILDGFPYDLTNNRFHIPYKDNENCTREQTIIHESLHIMFFNFCKLKINGTDKNLLWDLSEIINPIIQNRKPFIQMCRLLTYPYPAHAEQYLYLNKLFEKRKSMKLFIESSLKYLIEFEKNNLPYNERLKIESPPVLIKSNPKNNSKVNSKISNIVLEFDKLMSQGFCLYSPDKILEIDKSYWKDLKTLVVPVKNIKRKSEYKIHINDKDHLYLRSLSGKPLEPLILNFKVN